MTSLAKPIRLKIPVIVMVITSRIGPVPYGVPDTLGHIPSKIIKTDIRAKRDNLNLLL